MSYQNGNISVDDSFARFGGKSFAINKINSVEVRTEISRGSKAYIWFGLIGAVVLYFGIIAPFIKGGAEAIYFFSVAFFVAFIGFGFRSWNRRHDIYTYRLFLVTSSSEAQAFQTADESEIVELRDAIEDAMTRSS